MAEHDIAHIYSVLISLAADTILLPNTAVAEVLGQDQLRRESRAPWHLGDVVWANQQVPVISLERMLGQELPEMDRKSRLVVMNSPEETAELAIVARSYPLMVTLNEAALTPEPLGADDDGGLVLARARVANRHVIIPDMDEIARRLMLQLGD